MTDYVLHGRWLHPHTMKYFIATEGMRQALLSEGIAEDAVVVSGIPIRQAFETYQDRELLLKSTDYAETGAIFSLQPALTA